MRELLNARRARWVVAGVLAVAIAAAGGALAAGGGSTISACVKKHGGVFYHAKKCHKGDKKLTWNKQGIPGTNGKNGTNGTNGTNGKDGAVAGYSASQGSSVDLTNATGYTAITSKSLPAGSFIATASVEIDAVDSHTDGHAGVRCRLSDGATSVDSAWVSAVNVPVIFVGGVADGTIALTMPVSSSSASTLALKCYELDNDAGTGTLTISANSGRVTAVQTSANS